MHIASKHITLGKNIYRWFQSIYGLDHAVDVS